MTKDEALKMAIEALQNIHNAVGLRDYEDDALQACKEALEQPAMTYEQGFDHGYEAHRVEQQETWFDEIAQPAQEPVLYIDQSGLDGHATWAQPNACQDTDIPLYTHPHQWQGLSYDEIDNARYNWERHNDYKHNREIQLLLIDFARAIEQALKEKNTVTER